MFKGMKVLVAGGTGLIGRPLVEMLLQAGAKVRVSSLDDPSRANPDTEFLRLDLMNPENCMNACKGMEYVFNLTGVKGSPAVTRTKPASFFVPMITLDTNLMEAARKSGVRGFVFTSSIAVYSPAEVFREDDVWKTMPSENDWFAGWAKRMGELQADAYRIEHNWNQIAVVRPANVYGPYDNFDFENAMVVPSLIKRAVSGENPLTIWGDGSSVRDFIHARDVARGILIAAEKNIGKPVNLGSGRGVSIRELVDVVVGCLDKKPEVIWDTSKPRGDARRVMDMERARAMGFEPKVSLKEGIQETMEWYQSHKNKTAQRFDVFR